MTYYIKNARDNTFPRRFKTLAEFTNTVSRNPKFYGAHEGSKWLVWRGANTLVEDGEIRIWNGDKLTRRNL